MKIAKIMKNDVVNGQSVCVSLWVSGCPHHCPGCHNAELWSPNNGYVEPYQMTIETISSYITANGLLRNFSVLGGEPLAPYNIEGVAKIIKAIREKFPTITIYLWTGYTLEELKEVYKETDVLNIILNSVDILIDGRYEEDKRDLTLELRGSSNQRILHKGEDY